MYSKILYTLILSLLYSEKDVFLIFVLIKISEIISKYKQHSETSKTQKESPAVDTNIKPDLRKAVLPTGKAPASTALTEDEIIKAAMNREMKRYAGLT